MNERLIHDRYSMLLMLAVLLATPAAASATTYKVDRDHTSITFRVRHLFTQVSGRFDRFDGKINFDPAHPEQVKVEGSIDVASINTNVQERDKDLRSKRFFDADTYPTITFVSTGVSDVDATKTHGKLMGQLSMHGVQKPVVLEVSYLGAGKDPWGNQKAGFTAKTTINRKDFGLTWNETLESGGVLVGDDVEVEIQAEGMLGE